MDGTKPTFEQRLEALERAVFGQHMPPDQKRPADDEGVDKVKAIWRIVSDAEKIPIGFMRIRLRTKKVAFARQIAMAMAAKHSGLSYGQIAALFNRRNHTTITHACKVVHRKESRVPSFRSYMAGLRRQFAKGILKDT